MFRKLKDRALSWSAEQALGSALAPFGQLLSLEIDSKAKRIEAIILLKGEVEPLAATMFDYQLINSGPELVLTFNRIATSREWVTTLAETLLPDRAIKLPPKAAQYSALIQLLM